MNFRRLKHVLECLRSGYRGALNSLCSDGSLSFSHPVSQIPCNDMLITGFSSCIVPDEHFGRLSRTVFRNFRMTNYFLDHLPPDFYRLGYLEKLRVFREILEEVNGDEEAMDELWKELNDLFDPMRGKLKGSTDLQGELLGIFLATRYRFRIRVFAALLLLILFLSFSNMFGLKKKFRKRKKNWNAFVSHLKAGEIQKIIVHPDGIMIHTALSKESGESSESRNPFKTSKKKQEKQGMFILPLTGREFDKRMKNLETELGIDSIHRENSKTRLNYKIFYRSRNIRNFENTVIMWASIVITIAGLGYLVTRGVGTGLGGAGAEGGANSILSHQFQQLHDSSVTFKDVAGLSQQKVEIREFVDFLEQFGQFQEIGCLLPRGCLLVGPPGCGKTMLAKAVAGECNLPFFSAVGSEFVEMFVGIGPARVRELFGEARASQPCIVFIDEIDAVGGKRGSGHFLGRNDERENTLNQLLIEMDGFSENENVLVMAATNRLEILDPALLRSGRFDRQIMVSQPDVNERAELFELYMKTLTLSEDDDVAKISDILSRLSPGCSGADIQNICNEAAILATRDEKSDCVSLKHFSDAIDKAVSGFERKSDVLSESEREIVAVHEAGHVIAGWFLPETDPVLKATIVPRSSGALGFTQFLPSESWVSWRDQVSDRVCMVLGGRAAEDVFFDYGFSSGASGDLSSVTEICLSMVHDWGFFPDELGHVAFVSNPHILEIQKPYSKKTEELIDDAIQEFVGEMYAKTVNLMEDRRVELDAVAQGLLQHDTLNALELREIIGCDPLNLNEEFEEYLRNSQEIIGKD